MSYIALGGGTRRAGLAKTAAAPVFTLAIFLSASLVFSVQPMFAKMVLPIVGGSAAVWNVALVFFQGALLIGYIYAHLLQRVPFKAQVGVHLGVLALAGLTLPIAVAGGFQAPPESGQALWLLGLFALSVGAPFVAISATAPLLQAWFARTGRADAGDPYFLYAASNLGSLIALLGYPLIVEPVLGSHGQADAWLLGFLGLGVMIAACGLMTLACQVPARASEAQAASVGSSFRSSWGQRFGWMVYAFAPSMLLVGASTHISKDVASAPLLWVAPLALYLVAFIVAFSRKAILPARSVQLFHLVIVVSALILSWTYVPWISLLIVTLLALFLGSWVCLQELYSRRPEASGLTEFYMWMSVGGVLGGAFAALAAPVVFETVLEYPLALALTLLLRPWGAPTGRAVLWGGGALVVLAALLVAVPSLMHLPVMPALVFLAMGLAVIGMVMVQRHPLALFCGALAIISAGKIFITADNIYQVRSFYGVMDVADTPDGQFRLFSHGTTVHGVQQLGAGRETTPSAYYGPLTPIGQAITTLQARDRLHTAGAIGLGLGAVSCYARPGESWTYYEIDPLVVQVARDRRYFRLLNDCVGEAPIKVGDGRLLLAQEPANHFDFLLVDAFSSDSVPAHLLTKEAFAMMLSRLTDTGVAVLHISNRYLALGDIVARTARAAGAVTIERNYVNADTSDWRWANLSSQVMVIAKSEEAIAPLMLTGDWAYVEGSDRRVWTDDYTNIMEPLLTRMSEQRAK